MSRSEERERERWLAAFGGAVRELRSQIGISQEQFGFRTALDRTYVSGIERGVRNPTLWVLRRVADGLGVAPSELLRMAEEGRMRSRKSRGRR